MKYDRKDYLAETVSAQTVGPEFQAKSEGPTVTLAGGQVLKGEEAERYLAHMKKERAKGAVYVGHRDIRKKQRQQVERELRRSEGEATDADVARIIAAQRKRDLKAAKRAGRPPIT